MDFLMVIIASGFAYGHVRTTACNGGGVMQDGGHTPANSLTWQPGFIVSFFDIGLYRP